MKKIKFLSGAMFALAAVAFATTFTSCEKEELRLELKPQVATLTIDAAVVVIEDGVTVETKEFSKSETSQPGASIAAGSFAVSHTYTFQDGTVKSINETVVYPTVLPGQNVALTPTFIITHNNVFPEQETTIEPDTDGATVEEGAETEEMTTTNASEYYYDTTVEYEYKTGLELLDWGVTEEATAEEYVAISQLVKNFNTVETKSATYDVVVYSGTKVVVTITQNYMDSTVKVYRKVVENATRADEVEIGWYEYRTYTEATVDSKSTNLEDGKPGHGHGHGHGHGGGNAGGGIIWE